MGMEPWSERVIEYPNPDTHHHKHRTQDSFYLVENTFNNTFYRFGLNETSAIREFVNDPEWGPATYSVHYIGPIVNVTSTFPHVTIKELKK